MKVYMIKTRNCEDTEQLQKRNHIGGYIFMKEKVVLAYSGGLDTTAIIPWLKEHFHYDVVCC